MGSIALIVSPSPCFNRTLEELKWMKDTDLTLQQFGFNRTLEELKWRKSGDIVQFSKALIEP